MKIEDGVRSLGDTIATTASVKTVFGEPVVSGKRVVVPVATIRCAFGGGGGGGEQDGDPKRRGGGGGGGGAVVAKPVGVVDVTEEAVRFVYYRDPAVLAAASAAAGLLLGLLIGRRRCGKG